MGSHSRIEHQFRTLKVENVLQQKNKELDALNQKMLSVMDEKDYQIRVSSRTLLIT